MLKGGKAVLIVALLCLIVIAVVFVISANGDWAYEFDCEPVIEEINFGDDNKSALYYPYNIDVTIENGRHLMHVINYDGTLVAIDDFRIKVKMEGKTLYINYKKGDVVGVSTILGDCVRFSKNNVEYGIYIANTKWRY